MAFAEDFPSTFQEGFRKIREILSRNRTLVQRNLVDTEAEQILAEAYEREEKRSLNRLELFSKFSHPLPPRVGEQSIIFATQRSEGKPLQYILQKTYFFQHTYEVNPSVLIPRPETEVLVQEVSQYLTDLKKESLLGFEIGLGSGAISIELLSAFSQLRMVATEASAPALEVARRNQVRILGMEAVRLESYLTQKPNEVIEPFVLQKPEAKADFLVSNPPYLVSGDEIDDEVRQFEPSSALFPQNSDPFFFYERIAKSAAEVLQPEGKVFLEIPHERGEQIFELFQRSGWCGELRNDLTGRPRILFASSPRKG